MAEGLAAIAVGTPVSATGGVSRAPLGTGGVVGFDTTLPAGFVQVGRISEDGLTENYEVETEKVKDWAGKTVKILKTDSSLTYEFTVLETSNAENLRFLYGEENVDVDEATGDISVDITGDMLPAQEFAFTMREGSNGPGRRIHVPYGQPTMSSEVSYVNNDVIKYTVTVDALSDDAGVMARVFLADGTTEAIVTP